MATLIHSPLSLERFQDGTAAAPSIAFASDTDTGFYSYAANTLGFAAGGTLALRLGRSLGDRGYIAGIANSGALNFLDNGSVLLEAGGTNQNITLTPSGTGNVLVTASANTKLRVQSASTGIAEVQASGADAYFSNVGGGSTFIRSGNSSVALTLDASQNATFAGNVKLNAGDGDKIILNTYGSGTQHLITSESGWGLGIKGGGTNSSTQSTIRLYNWTGAAYVEQARLVNSGSLLLGTTTDSSNGRLQLTTHTTSAGGIAFGTDMTFYRIDSRTMAIDSTDASGRSNLTWRNNGADQFEVYNDTAQALVGTRNSRPFILRANQLTVLTLDTSQNATFAGSVTLSNTGAGFGWSGRGALWSSADGVFRLLNAAGTDFSRLQFGGTTSSFPALKRTSTTLEARLADDSGWANVKAGNLVAATAATTAPTGQIHYGSTTDTAVGASGAASALPANPLGYIIVNVAGTAAKIPYYNN